ncbi:hypothetical protein [Novosphingobium lentum]|uniref:hypothetical protein n=1 Tax=Novosphingobium lentum TaxID=145287 RepID=UPI0012ED876C|nr:hypothetical protein [Novosphingobium lentum]
MAGLAGIIAVAASPGVSAQAARVATATATPAAAPVQPPEGSIGGMGDVNIFPKRVVIDPRQRIGSIGLFNRVAASGDYEVTLGDLMMTEDGDLIALDKVTDPALRARVHPAGPLLRWSPHRVTLAGNEAQTVRVMAHAAPDTPPGEYRSHFSIISVPPATDGLTIDSAAGAASPGGIGVRIVPRFGISIPVIVRVGETTLTVGLRDLAVSAPTASPRVIDLVITRDGTRSAFGDLSVTAKGQRTPVAEIKGIGVYTEVGARKVHIPVAAKTDPQLLAHGAKLTVTYTDDDAAPGKILARQEFTVP